MVTNIWLKNYLHAKKYYEEHGNLLVPRHYYITYDNKEFRLGTNAIKDKESARTLTRTYTMPIIKGSIYEKCEELYNLLLKQL